MRTFAQKPSSSQQVVSVNSPKPSRGVNSVLHLQHPIGNQAVQRLQQSNAEERNTVLTDVASPHFGLDFSRIPVRAPVARPIQTKLEINRPGDKYEQEADRISARVTRMPEPKPQRACACGGACPRCKAGKLSQESDRFQIQRYQANETVQDSAPPIAHEVLQSSGQPLDSVTRAYMEPRFGYDFSKVQVHIDDKAAKSAQAMNALAYTAQHHIVFGANQFSPLSDIGRRLLAHELTHVIQQDGGASTIQSNRMIMRQVGESHRGDSSEPEVPAISSPCPAASPPCEIPPETFTAGRRLSPAEVARRRTAVQGLIDRTRSSTPLAAANLQHWLDGSGSLRSMPPEPFQRSDSGVGRELRRVHWPVIRQGVLRRLRDRGDSETLATAGTVRTIHFWHSISASPTSSNNTERDLSIALGTYAVTSYVTVRSTGTEASILSWCIQVCDGYDWNVGAIAPVPIPSELGRALADTPNAPGRVLFPRGREADTAYYISDDDWFRDLETSGGGRRYHIRTNVFSMSGMPTRVT
jgi:Domain of unknown function (DUF4157)